jgi:hypothetical protein
MIREVDEKGLIFSRMIREVDKKTRARPRALRVCYQYMGRQARALFHPLASSSSPQKTQKR